MPNPGAPSPALAAAVFLLARDLVPGWSWPATVTEALSLVGAGKSQTYEVLGRLNKVVGDLAGNRGRPRPPANSAPARVNAVLSRVRDYLMSHGGAVCGTGPRRVYSDGFRRLIVSLADAGQPGQGMTVEELASAAGVPLGTLKDWLSVPREGPVEDDSPPRDSSDPAPQTDVPDWIRVTHMRQIATLWPSWEGSFQQFCQMLRAEHRLSYGDTFIGNFLQAAGLRQRQGRGRTPVEAPWSSHTFRSFFPGAQWLGDGTTIAVQWGELVFCFNLEALFDPASDALVGFTVSDAEDAQALRRAFEMGVTTAGGSPLALSLDNKPCNHSPDAAEAVTGTPLLRATPGRGQAKAPLEGAFGLFQQTMPPLIVEGQTSRERARSVLDLVFTAWARGRNGKPRKRLKGLTPAQAYANSRPTPAETREALEWIQELHRRQERARLTREARRDPVRLKLLDEGLAQLGIPDPARRLAVALAYYSRDAIARGLATLRTKLSLGTIPSDADPGRYLGGIIRRLHTRLELDLYSDHLLEQRIRLRDIALDPLERTAAQLRADLSDSELPGSLVDLALHARYRVDFRYWTEAAATALGALPLEQRVSHYRSLSRRIAASFKTERERREDLIDRLAESTAAAQRG